jgi:hypothetical protein
MSNTDDVCRILRSRLAAESYYHPLRGPNIEVMRNRLSSYKAYTETVRFGIGPFIGAVRNDSASCNVSLVHTTISGRLSSRYNNFRTR